MLYGIHIIKAHIGNSNNMDNESFAVIGDLHFGHKEDHDAFVKYQVHSYLKVIDDIKSKGIKTVIILGDSTNNRKSITWTTMELVKDNLIDPDLHYIIIVGNHDAYYKNTNKLSSIRQLFKDHENVDIIDTDAIEMTVDSNKCLFVPWMTDDNIDTCMSKIEASDATYCFGHFPINGALMTKGIVCGGTLKSKMFKKFKKVISGHFHLKQKIGSNIIYIGSMCQLDWNDYGDSKVYLTIGKNVKSHQIVDDIFVKISIDKDFKFDDLAQYKDKFLKIYVNRKMKGVEESALIEIIENCIKHEIIDNTIILDEALVDVKDQDFDKMVSEYLDTVDSPKKIKKKCYEIIINEYDTIQAGE